MTAALPARRGRPLIDASELRERLCKLLLAGTPLAVVCRKPVMPNKATLHAWRRRTPAFDAGAQDSQWERCQLLCEGLVVDVDRMCAAGGDSKLIRRWFNLRRALGHRHDFPVPPRNALDILGGSLAQLKCWEALGVASR